MQMVIKLEIVMSNAIQVQQLIDEREYWDCILLYFNIWIEIIIHQDLMIVYYIFRN